MRESWRFITFGWTCSKQSWWFVMSIRMYPCEQNLNEQGGLAQFKIHNLEIIWEKMHFLPSLPAKQHSWGNGWGYVLSTGLPMSRLWLIDRNNMINQIKSEGSQTFGGQGLTYKPKSFQICTSNWKFLPR